MKYPQNKVMLACNDAVNDKLDQLTYPVMASVKMDGIRLLIYDGNLFSRKLILHPSKILPDHLKEILKISKKEGMVFDGELWSPDVKFNDVASSVRSFENAAIEDLSFYVFDCISLMEFARGSGGRPFQDRAEKLKEYHGTPNCCMVDQQLFNNSHSLLSYYNTVIESGYEGLIVRKPTGYYKHGRSTLKEGWMLKMKENDTKDVTVIEVVEAKKMKDGVIRERDSAGELKRPFTKDSYENAGTAGSLFVRDEEGNRFNVGFGEGFTAELKQYIWDNKDSFIGRTAEIISMPHGELNVPRMPKLVRFRSDK